MREKLTLLWLRGCVWRLLHSQWCLAAAMHAQAGRESAAS